MADNVPQHAQHTNNPAPTTAPTPKKREKLPAIEVSRNDVDLKFVDTEVMKGKSKGWPYLAPEKTTTETLDTLVGWMGRDVAAQKLHAFVKGLAQGWMEEAESQATGTDGKVDHAKLLEVFGTLAKEFSARGESIPKLKEQIEELTNCMTALDLDSPNFQKEFKGYAEEIKQLQIAIQAKRRKSDEEEAAANA